MAGSHVLLCEEAEGLISTVLYTLGNRIAMQRWAAHSSQLSLCQVFRHRASPWNDSLDGHFAMYSIYAPSLIPTYITKRFCFVWIATLPNYLPFFSNAWKLDQAEYEANQACVIHSGHSLTSSHSLRSEAHFGSFPWWLRVGLKTSIAAGSYISMRLFHLGRAYLCNLGWLTGWHGMSVFQSIGCDTLLT